MTYNKNNCNTWNCNCNKPDEKKCDNSLCCDGLSTVKFNVAKAKTICAYVDRIFDSKEGTGSPLFHALTTDATDYISTLTLNNTNANCCTTCTVGADATFFVDNCTQVELIDINVTAPTPAQVLVNGAAVTAVDDLGSSDFEVTLGDANIISVLDCDDSAGKKSTLMLDAIGPWTYKATFKLSGSMNFSGQTCNFEAIIESTTDVEPDTAASTLIVQSLCIPSKEAKIKLSIGGQASVINPQITYDETDNIPILTANVVIIPTVVAEVIENKKVCIQAVLD